MLEILLILCNKLAVNIGRKGVQKIEGIKNEKLKR